MSNFSASTTPLFQPMSLGIPDSEIHRSISTFGTGPAGKGTSAGINSAVGDVAESADVGTPISSRPRQSAGGQSLAKWAIDRRRVAKELKSSWTTTCEYANTDSFALRVGDFIDQINKRIPDFTNVPNEDAFAASLQLIRDALRGRSFLKMEQQKLYSRIAESLVLIQNTQQMTLDTVDKVIDVLAPFSSAH